MNLERDPVKRFPVTYGDEYWSWEGCFADGTSLYKCKECRRIERAQTPQGAELKHHCMHEND